MYGLPSRDLLSKRQSRWVREVDESVRSNPAQNAFNREPPSNPIRDNPSIITSMANPQERLYQNTDSSMSLSTTQNPMLKKNRPFNNHLMGIIPDNSHTDVGKMQSLYEELSNKYSKLEQQTAALSQKYETLKQSVSEQSKKNKQDPRDLASRIKRLEQASDFSSLVTRVSNLEQSISEMSVCTDVVKSKNKVAFNNSSAFSSIRESELSVVCTEHTKYEFLPYFIKEDYAGRDNITKLNGTQFEMIVEILGFYSDAPIIYPFGVETNLPKFDDLQIDMSFKDSERMINGTAYGDFKRRDDGIYTIHITELYSDGNASGLESYTLPLTLSCKTNLILE